MEASITTAVIHRSRLLREALVAALSQLPDVSMIADGADAAAIWALAGQADVRVFVIDLGLPDKPGLADAREISQQRPQAAILMLGATESQAEVLACCEAGATGYLTPDVPLEGLALQVRAAAAGEAPCSPRVAAFLFSRVRERAREQQRLERHGAARLTRRELEIVALIDEGLSNKEIAARLELHVQTVKNHVHNILDKLKLDGRRAAVRYALERGLLPGPAATAQGHERAATRPVWLPGGAPPPGSPALEGRGGARAG